MADPVVGQSAVDLLLPAHGELMRLLANHCDVHFQGLAQAARFARKSGFINNATAKKLVKLDDAYNLIRHITAPGAIHAYSRIPVAVCSTAASEP